MQRPQNVPINKVLANLSEKIAQLELENTHFKSTIEVYEELIDGHTCQCNKRHFEVVDKDAEEN